MAKFKAIVTHDVPNNRLLSLEGKDGTPEISLTDAGGSPDFRSTGELTEGQEIIVTVKNDPVWDIEAGEDIPAGSSVEAGKDGVVVSSKDGGFGFVTFNVKEGEVAQVVRRSGGIPGPRGPRGYKGNDGGITESQYKDIIARLDNLEKEGE